MNVTITGNNDSVPVDDSIESKRLEKILNEIFKNGIFTPDEVIDTYELLQRYAYFSGKLYEIKMEENTIV